MNLYFDTETSGLPIIGDLSLQPHIVQLAAILTDENFNEVASVNLLIKPTDWTIDQGAADAHGITAEKAFTFGVEIAKALSILKQFTLNAKLVVAHNIPFDTKLVGFECERFKQPNFILERPKFCTMAATTNLCKLPGRYGKYKWPKLQEAYVNLFGVEFEDAHDALADVRACLRIHKHLAGVIKV